MDLYIYLKVGNISKTVNLIERLNKPSKCFEELYYFFIMSDVEKRAILVTSNWNNLYFCVTPYCRLFFNEKTATKNKIIHKIIWSNVSKSSIKKSKRNPWIFGFDLDRLAHGRTIFAPVREYLRNRKKISACLKKVLKLCTELRPYIFTSCLFNKATQLFRKQKIIQN